MRVPQSRAGFLLRLCCLAAVLFLTACSPRGFLAPPASPFNAEEVNVILRHLSAQGTLVNTLFCTGTLTSKKGITQQEAAITIVGKRNPFQIKIEITHPWGSPIANLIADDHRFTLILFPEKQILLGSVKKGKRSRSFPIPLDPASLWSLVRGYPVLPQYAHAGSPKKDVIRLFNGQNSLLRRIDVGFSPIRPRACFFPETGMTQYFGSFEKDGDIEFAREVTLKDSSAGTSFRLLVKHVLFNPLLPAGVFQVVKPGDFKTILIPEEKPGEHTP
jgi:hypothetical protein